MPSNDLEYIREWQKRNTIVVSLRCNLENDADVIERLNSVGNKCGYIKGLIRKDMETVR